MDETLSEIRDRLDAAGIESAAVDAELILGHVLGASRGGVQALAITGAAIRDGDRAAALGLAEERARRIPLQHLTGRAPFRTIELEVGPGVFVPRPETETVVQFALDALLAAPEAEPVALDLCTGSGAIALALASELSTVRVWAVERSPEALAWAERNVSALGRGRVRLIRGDVRALDPSFADSSASSGEPADPRRMLSAREARDDRDARGSGGTGGDIEEIRALAGRVRVLVSNPPYVPESMVPRDPEVRDHDPESALYAGADGLDLIRRISRAGRVLVAPGGTLVLEHAEQQGAAIRALLSADGWRAPATFPDQTGRDRATTAVR
ncbi:peptide chain release factor N(5)-glutamine methyltransferase [Leucobacter weissii]|uniref:Release factor glutamine methyltransferase n=1 Tax=Leucobacter weissii TaxID=1983706 RepID=A0A939ML71_9MICO|nr:peptide chain release factor N(5)-glutamine methyltransferase [Leucobacter weissii]